MARASSRFDIKAVAAWLAEQLPPSYKVILEFDEGNRNDKARTLRIRTPHRFEDGEVMYAYIDIDNAANRRVRVSDDGVTTDWLRHHDAFWTLCEERQHV